MILRSFAKKTLEYLPLVPKEQLSPILEESLQTLLFQYEILNSLPFYVLVVDQKLEFVYANQNSLDNFFIDAPVVGKSIIPFMRYSYLAERMLKITQDQQKHINLDWEMPNHLAPTLWHIAAEQLEMTPYPPMTLFILENKSSSQRKMIEKQRKENLMSLDYLAAGLAHELKNPLASIRIHLDLMKKFLHLQYQELSPEVEKTLLVLDEEFQRLHDMTSQFIVGIRPLALNLKKTRPEKILEQTLHSFSATLEHLNILVKIRVQSQLPAILFDEKYLNIVYSNLIQNAIESFPPEQKEKIISLELTENFPFIEFIIQDNGVGIPEADRENVFRPYFTTKLTGHGIGLSFVYKILLEHSGDIHIFTPKKSSGVGFRVSLPAYKESSSKFIESPSS